MKHPHVRWASARLLEPYLEHDGTINDEECGERPGGYLDGMADAGIFATDDDPIVLGVQDDGTASIHDGNHRLILALDDPEQLVPYVVERVEHSTFPGVPYDMSLGQPAAAR